MKNRVNVFSANKATIYFYSEGYKIKSQNILSKYNTKIHI